MCIETCRQYAENHLITIPVTRFPEPWMQVDGTSASEGSRWSEQFCVLSGRLSAPNECRHPELSPVLGLFKVLTTGLVGGECILGGTTMGNSERDNFDLLDELELLLHRKGRTTVLLVTFIALAVCFLVVGILMATGIMLVTFFLFICYSEPPSELNVSLNFWDEG